MLWMVSITRGRDRPLAWYASLRTNHHLLKMVRV